MHPFRSTLQFRSPLLRYEVMYNGHTGRRMPIRIFFGPTYYQRLKHLVDDKIFARNKEKTQGLTRQPTMGRSRGGGLRFGEMERDCIIAHGSANFLKERLFYQSDAYEVHVCNKCGLMCKADMTKHIYLCQSCNNTQVRRPFFPIARCSLLLTPLFAVASNVCAPGHLPCGNSICMQTFVSRAHEHVHRAQDLYASSGMIAFCVAVRAFVNK